MRKAVDHAGKTFGMWTVLSYAGPSTAKRKGGATWLCRCECGNEKVVTAESLVRGKSKSCGCSSIAFMVAKVTKHGHSKLARKNKGVGPSGTYGSWHAMLQRCKSTKFKQNADYGGRGITVCERWHDFRNFLADMGERPEGMTLDRFPDVNGNYEPGNCRWATQSQQAMNKRPRVKHADVLGIVASARGVIAANDNEMPEAVLALRASLAAFDARAA